MVKAGLIVAAVVVLLSVCGAVISPLLVPCTALLAGGVAGYLAPVFENPSLKNEAVRRGLYAGAIASIGTVLGQIIGAVINGLTMGPEGLQRLMAQLGQQTIAYAPAYWFGVVGGAVCLSVVNVIVATGLGALGGLLWWQFVGSSRTAGTPPPAMQAQ